MDIILVINLLFLFIIHNHNILCDYPKVILDGVVIRGRPMKSEQDKTFAAFLGIPYADPPKRFQRATPNRQLAGSMEAWTFKERCPYYNSQVTYTGNEDCLYLNVYTPSVEKRSYDPLLRPVMVFIQSEDFESGDSFLYGPEKLIDRGIVLVTFNYRLGIFGFLSTGDDVASGNWGLYDQQLVLEWVKGHISVFQGDPNTVTIFGQGTGAASVFFHLLSPLSQGLFHRAIMQSGSGLCDWAIERNPLKKSREIASQLGCPTMNTESLVDCLRKASLKDLLIAQNKNKIFSNLPYHSTAVIEKTGSSRFLPEDPKILLSKGVINRVPIIIGLNKEETTYFHTIIRNEQYRGEPIYYEKYLIPTFLEAATPFVGELKNLVVPELLYKYFNGIEPNNITQVTKRFINMTTDAMYTGCIDETAKALSNYGLPVHMYVFEHKGVNSMTDYLAPPSSFDTICHGDELIYIFNIKVRRFKKTTLRDDKVSSRMVTLWTDFAKYGYAPRLDSLEYPKWPRFNSDYYYYLIGDTLKVEKTYKQSESILWNTYLKNISGIPGLLSSRPVYKTIAWAMVAVSLCLLLLLGFLLTILFYQRRSSTFRSENASNLSTSSGLSSEVSPWLNKMARQTYHNHGDIFTTRSDNMFKKTYSLQFSTKLPFRPIIFPSTDETNRKS